jgi:hypothetical protein
VVVVTAAALTGGEGVGAGATTGSGGDAITVSGVAELTPFCVATLAVRVFADPPRPSTNQIPTPLRTTATIAPSA